MGGKEAAAIIRQQNALVPIIFLTGEIAVSMKECVKTFAPSYLLLKPSNKRTLVAVSLQLVFVLDVIRLCAKFESTIDPVATSNTHSVHSSNALLYISASTTAPARAWLRSANLNAI
jgi:CheY-like chemotaxis protein